MATVQTAVDIVTSLLNASFSYGINDNTAHPVEEVEEVVLESDIRVSSLIASVPSHPERNSFLVLSSFTDGGVLPNSTGPYGSVRITKSDASVVEGRPIDVTTLQLYKQLTNVFTDASIYEGYYSFVSNRGYFTGSTAQVDTFPIEYDAARTDLLSPDSHLPAVVAFALEMLYAKETDDSGAAAYYGQVAEMYRKNILVAAGVIPPIQQYLKTT